MDLQRRQREQRYRMSTCLHDVDVDDTGMLTHVQERSSS